MKRRISNRIRGRSSPKKSPRKNGVYKNTSKEHMAKKPPAFTKEQWQFYNPNAAPKMHYDNPEYALPTQVIQQSRGSSSPKRGSPQRSPRRSPRRSPKRN